MNPIPAHDEQIKDLAAFAEQYRVLQLHYSAFLISAQELLSNAYMQQFGLKLAYADSSAENIDLTGYGRTIRFSLAGYREDGNALATVNVFLLPSDALTQKPSALGSFTIDYDGKTNIVQSARNLDLTNKANCAHLAVRFAILGFTTQYQTI